MCRVNMQGYLMEIDYGMHVRQRLEVRFDGIDCSYLDYRIEVLFGDPEVADYLLNEVRIGEDVVLVDEERCIGCKYCMMACPYGVRSWNAAEKCAEKCTLCGHLTSQDKLPACVKSCAAGARFYGDLDDPDSDASKELAKYSEGDIHTLQDVGNHPATRYIMTSMIGQWQDRIAPADHPHTAAYPVAE